MLSEASMGPPQDSISFVLNGSVQWDSHWEDTGSSAAEQEILRQIGANEDGRLFNVEDVQLLQGSGAFFALKIQKAKNKEQLKESVKEAESLRKLKGCPSIVQIVDHALVEPASLLLILMELGACDLHSFLQKSLADLSVPDVCRIWRSLVPAVTAAHGQGIIHRDIKPQNFLLVPVTPFADRVLATTSVPSEKFVFRMADEDEDDEDDHLLRESGIIPPGDVKLFLRDPSTGKEEILRLRIKLTDFGLAQPLEIDESHLSVKGCAGSILYMAPETLRPTKFGGTKKVSNNVDIWALGVILFRMLHDNRTPFETYHRADGPIGVAGAATNKEIHREVTAFGRQRLKVWMVERDKMLASEKVAAHLGATEELVPAREEAMARALLRTWMQTEFLFRMCEFCLAFDATDRAIARDLGRWIEAAFENEWWQDKLCAAEERHAGPVQHHNVLRIIGRMITEAALPEVFRRNLVNENGVLIVPAPAGSMKMASSAPAGDSTSDGKSSVHRDGAAGAVVPHVDGNSERPARGSGRSCLLISLVLLGVALVIGSVIGCSAYLNQHQSGDKPQPRPDFLDSGVPSTTTGGGEGAVPGGREGQGAPGAADRTPGGVGGAPGTGGGSPGGVLGDTEGSEGRGPGVAGGFLGAGATGGGGGPGGADSAPPRHSTRSPGEGAPGTARAGGAPGAADDTPVRHLWRTTSGGTEGPSGGHGAGGAPAVLPLEEAKAASTPFFSALPAETSSSPLLVLDRKEVISALSVTQLAAVRQNCSALQDWELKWWTDRQCVLAAVKQDGLLLQYAYEFNADPEVVLEAVMQNCFALFYASPHKKDDREFMLGVVDAGVDWRFVLSQASDKLRADAGFVKVAEDMSDPTETI